MTTACPEGPRKVQHPSYEFGLEIEIDYRICKKLFVYLRYWFEFGLESDSDDRIHNTICIVFLLCRYKRYKLSDGKDFSSLFFPEKDAMLKLLQHFADKSGETLFLFW